MNVLKYTAKVLIADGTPDSMGHALDSEAVTWPEGGVPVKMGIEDGAPIVGHATLSMGGFAVIADIVLNEGAMGGRTEDEVGDLVPAVAGMGNPEEFDMEVQYVALGDWENADGRITSLVPPPLHEVDDLGMCEVCGGVVTETTPWCPGPPDPPPKKVLDFPVPPEDDDAGPSKNLWDDPDVSPAVLSDDAAAALKTIHQTDPMKPARGGEE